MVLGVHKAVYVLRCDGAVSLKADMSVARAAHGVVALEHRQTVYVFGGCKCQSVTSTLLPRRRRRL